MVAVSSTSGDNSDSTDDDEKSDNILQAKRRSLAGRNDVHDQDKNTGKFEFLRDKRSNSTGLITFLPNTTGLALESGCINSTCTLDRQV